MLNMFINSNIYGQAIAATFDFSKDSVGKNFDGRRITPRNLSGINNPIYERKVDMEKIIDLYQTGQVEKVNRINKGINAENIRVNSLYLLCRELKMLEEKFSNPETAEEYKNQLVLCYVPIQLLKELQERRYMFYLDGSNKTTYYSRFELDMWIEADALIGELYSHVIFKNIVNCQKNVTNTPIQNDRVILYNSMNKILADAYYRMKELRENSVVNRQVKQEKAENSNPFNGVEWSDFDIEIMDNQENDINNRTA